MFFPCLLLLDSELADFAFALVFADAFPDALASAETVASADARTFNVAADLAGGTGLIGSGGLTGLAGMVGRVGSGPRASRAFCRAIAAAEIAAVNIVLATVLRFGVVAAAIALFLLKVALAIAV